MIGPPFDTNLIDRDRFGQIKISENEFDRDPFGHNQNFSKRH